MIKSDGIEPNKEGRPALFKSPEDLKAKIDEYLEGAKGKSVASDDPDEEPIKVGGYNITITGLALSLGFESRQSFYDYEKRPEFSYIIKRARLHVESAYENNLYSKFSTGSIFALKNMGWQDQQQIDHTTGGDKMGVITTMMDGQVIDLKTK